MDLKSSRLKISGKSILYRIDLEIEADRTAKTLRYRYVGSVRVGPVRSDIVGESYYGTTTSPLQLKTFQLRVPGFRINESYDSGNGTDVSEPTMGGKVPTDGMNCVDPAHLLFLLNTLWKEPSKTTHFEIPLGGKIRNFSLVRQQPGFLIEHNQEKLGTLSKEPGRWVLKPGRVPLSLSVDFF